MNKLQATLACLLTCGTFLAVTAVGALAGWPWIGLAGGVVCAFGVGRMYVGRFDDPWAYARYDEGDL